MITRRFGQKLKMPSIVSIKHQMLMMMLEEEIRLPPAGVIFSENKSPVVAVLRRLKSATQPSQVGNK